MENQAKQDTKNSRIYRIYETFLITRCYYNEDKSKFISDSSIAPATLYTKDEAKKKYEELTAPRQKLYLERGIVYQEIKIDSVLDDKRVYL